MRIPSRWWSIGKKGTRAPKLLDAEVGAIGRCGDALSVTFIRRDMASGVNEYMTLDLTPTEAERIVSVLGKYVAEMRTR